MGEEIWHPEGQPAGRYGRGSSCRLQLLAVAYVLQGLALVVGETTTRGGDEWSTTPASPVFSQLQG
jgi:hypothetical protein